MVKQIQDTLEENTTDLNSTNHVELLKFQAKIVSNYHTAVTISKIKHGKGYIPLIK